MFFTCLALQNPLPFEGGAGDGIVVEESKSDPTEKIFRCALPYAAKIACFVTQARICSSRILRQSESGRRPQRFSETLRIIDSAHMRMTKANMEKMEKLDTAVQKLGL